MNIGSDYLRWISVSALTMASIIMISCGGLDDDSLVFPDDPISPEVQITLTVNGESCLGNTFTITCDDNRELRRSETLGVGGGFNRTGYYKHVRQIFALESSCFTRPLTISAIWAGPYFSDTANFSLEEALRLDETSSEYEFHALIEFVDLNDTFWTNLERDNSTNQYVGLDSSAVDEFTYTVTSDFCLDADVDEQSLFLNGIYNGRLFKFSGLRDTSLDIRLELSNLYFGDYY